MGKKTRLPGATAGRRTILQLSPTTKPGGNAGEREDAASGSDDEQEGDGNRFIRDMRSNMKPSAVKATEGLSLLGAYEDSDDEEDEGDPKRSIAKQHNQSADIDSTLANFMAEIDAITTQPSSEDAASPSVQNTSPSRQLDNNQQSATSGEKTQQSAKFEYNTQYSIAGVGVEMGDWQEVWDDNSGCFYYWNTLSNEVSWELPHYLADQVQSLRQSANSASVNGNGSTHTECQAEEKNASTAAPTAVKETKAKEVIESVVGLTSAEEESRGVAASLLGPLISSEVKEAEEKWRKKLIKGMDESENSSDSEEEDVGPEGSPSPPQRDPDPVPSAPKDPPTKKQSGNNGDAEEETEEDTMELELALERKKAELRALEDGDGSAGGSSPCSEASLETAGLRNAIKRNRWKTAFPNAPSPDSNSRGSDTQDNTETAPPKVPESVVEGEDKETDTPEENVVTKPPVKEDAETSEPKVETPELRFQIGELANTLTSKMEFLGINKRTISNFQLLLLQTETRIADWREGALNGVYLRRRLQEAAEHIKFYELNAAPKGWSCHWDREHRQYFYVNGRTNVSQWDFPTEEDKDDGPKAKDDAATQNSSQGDGKTSASTGSSTIIAAPPSAPPRPSASALWSPSQPPLPDSPPPPPDCPPPPPLPPGSPPPPPPPPDSDGEIMEVEMDVDDDNDSEPPAPGTEEDGTGRPPLPPGTAVMKNVESSSIYGKSQKRKASQMNKAITIGSSPILYTQPAISAGFSMSAAPMMTPTAYWMPAVAAPLVPCEPPLPPVPAPPPQPPLPPPQPPSEPPKSLPTDKTKKAKKEKSKKSKIKMPSLVKKWQSIQKELDEEEKSSSSDEDRVELNKKNIEDWRQQMLTTGKASKNANFESLPDDWRQRLKKRKTNT